MAKKTAAVGNIEEMSLAELIELKDDLDNRIEKIESNERAQIKDTPAYIKLKEQFDALKKTYESAMGKYKITLNVPIEFTINISEPIHDGNFIIEYYDDYDIENIIDRAYSREITAKIVGNDLNKVQKQILSSSVEDAVASACSEIYGLFSKEEFGLKLEAFQTQYKKFLAEATKKNLASSNLWE